MISLFIHIFKHPFGGLSGIFRFIRWQFAYRLVPYPIIYNLTSKSRVLMKRGLTGMTLNYYTGLCELNDMAFLLHFLRADDLFVDIGANVGSYSVMALQETNAKVIAVEPVKSTFEILRQNIRLNEKEERAELVCCGIGSEPGTLSFTVGLDAMNHVSTESDSGEKQSVPINTLDGILNGRVPKLIKIDTEGFETEVIKGGTKTFGNPELQAIVIEICGMGDRYGHTDKEVHDAIVSFGFFPIDYDPFKRKIAPKNTWDKVSNTIYIRNEKYVDSFLGNAPTVSVQNHRI